MTPSTVSWGPPIGSDGPLMIAVPKGRLLAMVVKLLNSAGHAAPDLLEEDRRLIRGTEDGVLNALLLKPDDVPTYVEYGAADLGIVGRDVLLERDYDLYEPIDLGLGRCRMIVAGPPGTRIDRSPGHRPLRVGTKFPRIAEAFFGRRGLAVETIFLQGSVELAPLTGLSDVIVDLVESGETLRQNDLVELADVCEISTMVVVNRAQLKLRGELIRPLLERLASGAC